MMTPTQQAQFLAVLARTGKVERAAARAGVPRSSLYRHRTIDAEFRTRWDAAAGRRAAPASPPGQLLPAQEMTVEQRALARRLLDSLNASPPGSAASLAQAALERWLRGHAWQVLDDAALHELRRLSPRAHADYLGAPPADDVPLVFGEDVAEQQ